MARAAKITVKSDVVWREIDGEVVIIADDSRKMFVINDVGARIWSLLDGEHDLADIEAVISLEYMKNGHNVGKDITEFIENLRQLGILEE